MFRVIVLAIVLVLVLLPVPVLVQQPGIFVFFPGSLSCFFTLKEYPHVLQGFICWPIATLRVESAAIALLELYDDPPSSPSSSSLFVNCVLSILAKLQFDIFYIHSSHNMFRRRASCSRGGFRKTDKTFQQTKNVDIFWP